MIRPTGFGYNRDTERSNAFQRGIASDQRDVSAEGLEEFEGVVETLRDAGVGVMVCDDTPEPVKPDAVFPNNWVSFHGDGTVILYPMMAENRRAERRGDIIEEIGKTFLIREIVDLSGYESEGRFLEGTGSIVFDHAARVGYACLSPRTDEGLLSLVCERLGYRPLPFHAHDRKGREIYHTNVMMCIAERFAVVCLESIIG